MAETVTDTPCAVCRGAKSEHFDADGNRTTRHVYTTTEGDLSTPEQRAKQQAPQGQRVPLTPGMLGGGNDAVGRLVEVLMGRGILTAPEALYVAGMGSKPNPPSGYQDPMATALRLTGGGQ